MNIHSGSALCWICLEGGPDKKGEPLVRDCACRGSDAGFAHTSCIIKYAIKKSEQARDKYKFSAAWEKCPTCLQCYQNDLACHLSDAFVLHSKKTYGYPGSQVADKMKVLEALRIQIETRKNVIDQRGKDAEKEVETLLHELLAMVNQTKKEHNMDGSWLQMPRTTVKYRQYIDICAVYEAYGYYYLGFLCSSNSINTEISNYEKARDICASIGSMVQAQLMTGHIERARASSRLDKVGVMKSAKIAYEGNLYSFGQKSEHTIKAGIAYVSNLRSAYCSIEAERLVTKLIATSRQVFGEDHKYTKESLELLNEIKRRIIFLGGPGSPESFVLAEPYEALRYENDGEICIVTGPIRDLSKDRGEEEGQELRIASEFIYPQLGRCPVICHGLINASHLNGKLGEARSVFPVKGSSGGFRFVVHFEDTSLKPAAVKPENLRVVFELPSV